jgi:hypothetical protein
MKTNRSIWQNIHKIPMPTMIQEYNLIMKKESRLPKAQRDMIIVKMEEYARIGVVKLEPVFEPETT